MMVVAFFVILFVSDSNVNPLIPATTAPSSSATSLLQLDQNDSRRSLISTCLMVRGADVSPVGASANVWFRKSVMNQPENPTSGE